MLLGFDWKYSLPTEVDVLVGDASTAISVLGWESKISFGDLSREMVDSNFRAARHRREKGQGT
jgi:GDPmannose 4,6-dehydratase